jgi:ABC-type nickel/cobalt efflux system permease component RcnA
LKKGIVEQIMSISILSLLALGFVLGLKHALDADHLAAVSTIATERRSLIGSSFIGALWGLGHTVSLLLAGVLVILLHFEIGERTSKALEFCVGVMLVVLGTNALGKLVRSERIHMHPHEHDQYWHVHPHFHGKQDDRPHTHHGLKLGARPLIIGMVHGMAGSAALTLLVLASIPSPLAGFFYIVVFGIGSTGGMMIMSTLFVLPAKLSNGKRFTRASLAVRALAAVSSLGLGAFVIYDIGFVNHLLM